MDKWIWATHLVEEELKFPDSAKFPSYNRSYITESDGDTIVKSYVDADNSFGAELRVNFIVTFKDGDMDDYEVLILE